MQCIVYPCVCPILLLLVSSDCVHETDFGLIGICALLLLHQDIGIILSFPVSLLRSRNRFQ